MALSSEILNLAVRGTLMVKRNALLCWHGVFKTSDLCVNETQRKNKKKIIKIKHLTFWLAFKKQQLFHKVLNCQLLLATWKIQRYNSAFPQGSTVDWEGWICTCQVSQAWPHSRVTYASWFAGDLSGFSTEVLCPRKLLLPGQLVTPPHSFLCTCLVPVGMCTCGLFPTTSLEPTHLPRMTFQSAQHLNPASPHLSNLHAKFLSSPLLSAQAKGALCYTT